MEPYKAGQKKSDPRRNCVRGARGRRFGVNEFSICLERGNGAPGWLSWGGDVPPAMRESLIKLPVLGEHHWAVPPGIPREGVGDPMAIYCV